MVQNELEHVAFLQKKALANLKNFLGLQPTQELTPDLQNTHRQVLGSFDPASVTWEQTKSRSYDLKLMEITIKLQAYNVKLAKVKALPTVLFTTQTPDPLSSTTIWFVRWLRSVCTAMGRVQKNPQCHPAKNHLEAIRQRQEPGGK